MRSDELGWSIRWNMQLEAEDTSAWYNKLIYGLIWHVIFHSLGETDEWIPVMIPFNFMCGKCWICFVYIYFAMKIFIQFSISAIQYIHLSGLIGKWKLVKCWHMAKSREACSTRGEYYSKTCQILIHVGSCRRMFGKCTRGLVLNKC